MIFVMNTLVLNIIHCSDFITLAYFYQIPRVLSFSVPSQEIFVKLLLFQYTWLLPLHGFQVLCEALKSKEDIPNVFPRRSARILKELGILSHQESARKFRQFFLEERFM